MAPLKWTTLGLDKDAMDVMDAMGEMDCQAFQEEMDFLGLEEIEERLDHQDQWDQQGRLET